MSSHDTAVAATLPYALHAIADHITTHQLHVDTLDIGRDTATIWVLTDHVDQWLTTAIDIDDTSTNPGATTRWTSHTAHGRLHDSCVKVRIRWITYVDHAMCRGDNDDDCGRTICYCRTDQPCDGTVEPGCAHPGEFVCDVHRRACGDCHNEAGLTIATVQWI